MHYWQQVRSQDPLAFLNKLWENDRTSLLHLPSELTVKILSGLPGSSLTACSSVCWALRQLAIPILLSRAFGVDITEPIHLSLNPESFRYTQGSRQSKSDWALLQLLGTLRATANIRRLECTLNSSNFSPRVFPQAFTSLIELISGTLLRHADEVVLRFDIYSETEFPSKRAHAYYVRRVREILDSLATKPFTRLTIEGSRTVCGVCTPLRQSDFGPHSKQGPLRAKSLSQSKPARKHFLRRFSDIGAMQKPEQACNDPPNAVTTLKTVRITNDLAFTPQLITWMVSTLNASPITALFIGHNKLSTHDWSLFLPLICMPELSEFSLVPHTVFFSDLVDFLSRHTTITSLSLIHGCVQRSRKPNGPSTASISAPDTPLRLPLLANLCASSDYISLLLTLKKNHPQPDPFPNLRSVGIVPGSNKSDLEPFLNALRTMSDTLPATTSLSLPIYAWNGGGPWLTPTESVAHAISLPYTDLQFEVYFDDRSTVYVPIIHLPSIQERTAKWLGRTFPHLERVVFDRRAMAHCSGTSRRSFRGAIQRHCQNQERVEVVIP